MKQEQADKITQYKNAAVLGSLSSQDEIDKFFGRVSFSFFQYLEGRVSPEKMLDQLCKARDRADFEVWTGRQREIIAEGACTDPKTLRDIKGYTMKWAQVCGVTASIIPEVERRIDQKRLLEQSQNATGSNATGTPILVFNCPRPSALEQ